MASNLNIPIETLRKLIDYDPESGDVVWKARAKPDGYSGSYNLVSLNTRLAGRKASTHVGRNGYPRISIANKWRSLHRVIWAYVHGEWPTAEIDHINGIRTDNRICNLRLVTSLENAQNRKRYVSNRSGTIGVSQWKKNGKWRAYISKEYKIVYLGTFETKSEAVLARKKAELEAGYHPNHGRL